MITEIDRVPTREERLDMIIVGEPNILKDFSKKLAEVEMRFVKQHKPYDSQCARFDFKQQVRMIQEENEMLIGYPKEPKLGELNFDFEKYGNEDRFEEVKEDEEVDFMNINGIRTQVTIGKTIHYKCKRNHKFGVFIPTPQPELNQVELLQQLVEVVKTLKENK